MTRTHNFASRCRPDCLQHSFYNLAAQVGTALLLSSRKSIPSSAQLNNFAEVLISCVLA